MISRSFHAACLFGVLSSLSGCSGGGDGTSSDMDSGANIAADPAAESGAGTGADGAADAATDSASDSDRGEVTDTGADSSTGDTGAGDTGAGDTGAGDTGAGDPSRDSDSGVAVDSGADTAIDSDSGAPVDSGTAAEGELDPTCPDGGTAGAECPAVEDCSRVTGDCEAEPGEEMVATYYIDSQDGDDANDGQSPLTPWRSHTMVDRVTLVPGDIVAFKRGSSFSGPIEIEESGTADKPIRFTAYGEGELPKFTNTSSRNMNGNCFRLAGDYIILEKLHFHDTPGDPTGFFVMTAIGAVRILSGADHNIVRDNEFMKCPQGILSAGEHTLITRNYMDGPSEAIWNDGTNSWGPMGIHLNIGNQEVSYNIIKNHLTLDSPYGSDGSAIELDNGNYHKSNIYIHHNYTEGNAGFLESSWSYDWPPETQEVYDLRVAFNVSYDGQDWVYMWAPTHNVYFDNNTVIRSNQFGCPPQADDVALLHVQGGSPHDASQIHFRNNLFVYDNSTAGVYQGNAASGALKSNNWYLNFENYAAVLAGDASKGGDGDPLLVDLAGGDYHLTAESPLRGQGLNLSDTYSLDHNGVALPQTGGWDIGAMQFQ